MFKYTYQNDADSRSLTVFIDGQAHSVDSSHANFGSLLLGCRSNDEAKVRASLDIEGSISKALSSIASGFTYSDRAVSYDGKPVGPRLAQTILRILGEKGDVTPFTNFAARLSENPSFRSRKVLFDWIERHGLNIDESGNIIAYKGVTTSDSGDYVSITQGKGVVNGEAAEGALRNNIGDVVEVPRAEVDDDPNSHCSFGLHAGTYEYANGFKRGVLLTVSIDPADVVSVPNDGHKIRTCRYTVVASTETEWVSSVVWNGDPLADPVTVDFGDDSDDDYWGDSDEDDLY